MAWNPVAEPYRLVLVCHAGPKLHGWSARVRTFASEEEAVAELAKPFGRGVLSGQVERAINPETWTKNGRWVVVTKRHRAH